MTVSVVAIDIAESEPIDVLLPSGEPVEVTIGSAEPGPPGPRGPQGMPGPAGHDGLVVLPDVINGGNF